jgi:hypothetical protein
MISFITGKPGGGKGLLSMQQIIDELVQGTRHIICNTPVRLLPWIFGDGRAMIGLKAYLLQKYGKDFDCEKRVHILDDDDISSFYLWRVVDGVLVKANADIQTKGDGEQRIMGFDTSLASKSGGVLYVIDEAWKFYGSRNWQKTGEGMLFYSAQHRHFGDDVLIVTQHTKQIDPAIQRVAQDFWVVTNHSKLTMGWFRQPDVFSVAIYDQAPTGAALQPMTRKLFRLDRKGIAQTYDTSAGVGLTGRFQADVGSRKKGLPFWSLILIFIAFMVLTFFAFRLLFKFPVAMRNLFYKPLAASITQTNASPQPRVPLPASLPSAEAPIAQSENEYSKVVAIHPSIYGGSELDTNRIYCLGFACVGKDFEAFFSDGSTAYSDAGEISQIQPHWVTAWGRRYRVIVGHAVSSVLETGNFSQRDRSMAMNDSDGYVSQGQVSDPVPVNDAEILPSVNSQASGIPVTPRINGISNIGSHFQNQNPSQSYGGQTQ